MGRVQQALASIEQRFAAHNRKVVQAMGGPAAAQAARRSVPGAPARRVDTGAKELSRLGEIGKAVRAAEYREARAQIRAVEREKVASARRVAQEQKRQELAAIREAHRSRQSYTRAIGGGLKNAGGALASVGKMGAQAVGLGGGALAYGAVRDAVKLDEQTRRLIIQARGPGGKMQAGTEGLTPGKLMGQIQQTGIATGKSPEDIAAGMSAFVSKTGDLKTAVDNMSNFSIVAQATGASVEDVASAAADLSSKFDLKKPEEMANALAALAFQGKAGAFELKDMAAQFPKIGAAASRFGLKGAGGVQELGGLAQIARTSVGGKGAEGAAAAGTAVEAMLRQITVKADDLLAGKTLGQKVDVGFIKDPRKKQRSAREVLTDVVSASKGDTTKLQKIFGDEGIRGLSPMITKYRGAYAGAGGGKKGEEAGRAAVTKLLDESIQTAGTFKDIQSDAGEAMKASSVQWEIAMTKLKVAMSSELMPALVKLIPDLAKLAPEVAKLTKSIVSAAQWLAENPWKGLGALVAGAILKEIAMAKIGQLIAGAVAGKGGAGVASLGAGPTGFGGAALAETAAVAGVGLAVDQAQKLQKEAGTKTSVADLLPGMKGGSFSGLQLLKDLTPGLGQVEGFKKATAAGGELGGKLGGQPEMKRSAGYGAFNAKVELGQRGLVSPEQAGAVDALAKAAQTASAELQKIKSDGLNRGDAPSRPTK